MKSADWFEPALDGQPGRNPTIELCHTPSDPRGLLYRLTISGGTVRGTNGRLATYRPNVRLEFKLAVREDGEITAALGLTPAPARRGRRLRFES